LRQSQEITIFDGVTPIAITSSTDATPIVMTVAAHGLVTGDKVFIYGHTTNIAANGIFHVTKVTANTFQLQNEFTFADVAGTGAGAGGATGIIVKAPPRVCVADFKNAILSIITAGTATLTLKVAGSNGLTATNVTSARGDLPNFGATLSAANPYSFLQTINLDTSTAVNGATGIVVAGTDINVNYEVNINAIKYLTLFPISWTQGAITAKLFLTTDD
jgi:hypothetical protein